MWEGGKLAWQVKYQHAEQDSKDGIEELSQPSNISTPMAALSRLRHRLEVGYLCIIDKFYKSQTRIYNSLFTLFPQVRKDDVQTVVPISKSWSLMNTAVLTGRQVRLENFVGSVFVVVLEPPSLATLYQVSQPMKIFIVSEAGKIADVTLHTSCKSADESALKVKILTIH